MPQHHQHEPHDDTDIVRWFRALGPPPQGQAPPYLRTSVRAQIEQRRARRGIWAWLPQHWPAALVPALATGLVLSLAVNVWWGIGSRASGPLPGQPVHAYQFLQTIHGADAPARLLAAHATVGAQPIGLGFARQDDRIIFFRQGMLFTDALVALHHGAPQAASQRLDTLTQALNSVRAPQPLAQYLQEIHTLQQHQQYTGVELAKFLALFESLFEAEYTRTNNAAAVTLFRLGAWLETMALAATAGDDTALRQAPTVQYYRQALTALAVPPEVLQAFGQMQHLVAESAITAKDRQTVLNLVQQIQKSLGALDL